MNTWKFVIVLIISKSLLAQAGASDSLNVLDADGKKQGHWVVMNNMKKPPLPDYNSTQKVEEGKYKDDKKTGVWIMYFPNGNKRSEITWQNNSKNGYAKIYYETGEVMEEGDWKGSYWSGAYVMKYPNGNIQHKFNFNAGGKTEGPQEYHNEEGVLTMKGEKKNGKETGTWAYYDDKGKLVKEVTYNDGNIESTKIINAKPEYKPEPLPVQPVTVPIVAAKEEKPNMVEDWKGEGYMKLFNRNKQISKDGDFERFKLKNGKEYVYDENGIIQRIKVWKNFKYVGEAPIPKD